MKVNVRRDHQRASFTQIIQQGPDNGRPAIQIVNILDVMNVRSENDVVSLTTAPFGDVSRLSNKL